MSDELLTLAEAAKRLGRHVELVRVWVVAGRLAGRKMADRWFVSERDLARFKKHEPIRHKRRARRRAVWSGK